MSFSAPLIVDVGSMKPMPAGTGIQDLNVGYFPQDAGSGVTISAADSLNSIFRITGTSAANPVVTISRVPVGGAPIFIKNEFTGVGGNFRVQFLSGAAVTLTNTKNYILYWDDVTLEIRKIGIDKA